MSERTKNVLFAIFVVIMVAALAWLGWSERMRNRQIAENNRQLSESISKADAQLREAGEKVYDELADTIEDAGIGIVCIGDSEMAGNLQDSLPHELDDLTNDKLFAQISEDLAKKNKVYDTRYLQLEVANRGTKNEDLNAVLARCGAHQMLVRKGFVMPEGSDYVIVEMKDENGNKLLFAKQDNVKFGLVTIDGVEGRFYSASEMYDETHPKFTFRRDKGGNSSKVAVGTVVETEGATQYTGYYPVMFFGEQQDVDADEFVDGIKDIVAAYGKGGGVKETGGEASAGDDDSSKSGDDGGDSDDKTGSGSGRSDDSASGDEDGGSDASGSDSDNAGSDDSDSASDSGSGDDDDGDYEESDDGLHYAVICTTAEDSEYDKALRAAFGDRYFRNDKRSNEMTRSDYEKLAARIYESLDKQGTFNRIKKAVNKAEKSL